MPHAAHAGPFQRDAQSGAMYARLALQAVHETGMPSLLVEIAANVPRDGALALGFFTELAKLAVLQFRSQFAHD
jgi:hypothetical protein